MPRLKLQADELGPCSGQIGLGAEGFKARARAEEFFRVRAFRLLVSGLSGLSDLGL